MSTSGLPGALLEGGKRLEEFGQVNVRVAAGRQSFVGHFLQPAVHLFFFVTAFHAIWKRRRRKQELVMQRQGGKLGNDCR